MRVFFFALLCMSFMNASAGEESEEGWYRWSKPSSRWSHSSGRWNSKPSNKWGWNGKPTGWNSKPSSWNSKPSGWNNKPSGWNSKPSGSGWYSWSKPSKKPTWAHTGFPTIIVDSPTAPSQSPTEDVVSFNYVGNWTGANVDEPVPLTGIDLDLKGPITEAQVNMTIGYITVGIKCQLTNGVYSCIGCVTSNITLIELVNENQIIFGIDQGPSGGVIEYTGDELQIVQGQDRYILTPTVIPISENCW